MSRQNRVREIINLDVKKEINPKRESGKSVEDLNLYIQYIKIK